MMSVFSLAILAFFVVEIFFTVIRRPRGLTGIMLALGVLGFFAGLLAALWGQSLPIRAISANLAGDIIIAIAVGMFAAILAIIAEGIGKLLGVAPMRGRGAGRAVSRGLETRLDQLIAALGAQTERQSLREDVAAPINTAVMEENLLHMSKQLYDLTQQMKHELEIGRKQSAEHTQKMLDALLLIQQNLMQGGFQRSAAQTPQMGPKVSAQSGRTGPITANMYDD